MQMFEICEDDLTSESPRELLALHLAGMHASSPPDAVFGLELSGPRVLDVTVWSVRESDAVTGIGALKALADGTGEIRTMRTHRDGALLRLRRLSVRLSLRPAITEP